MKAFTDYVNNVLKRYTEDSQQADRNLSEYKWFTEYFQEPDQTAIIAKYDDVEDCGSRSAIKEMSDFEDTLSRASHIRNKKRQDFYICSAIRREGLKARLTNKTIFLSDRIS